MSDKTMKQIADTLGVHKTRVYRYIKEQGIEPDYSRNGANYFGEEKCNSIISAISETLQRSEPLQNSAEPLHETSETVLETLVKQLEIKDLQLAEKDKQIEQLAEALKVAQQAQQELATSLHTAQALHAGTIQQGLIEDKQSKGFWSKIFGRKGE